ncbi:hypothetical protein B0H19DRAFT_12123 [Mycena capillaripes]|nr:hypothetical protein B0H19DRAFT_12123 [Mycena capillaripes]
MRTWEILGRILCCLTLPRLTSLRFIQRPDNIARPLWNHTHFLNFASRSSLRTTLTQLEIYAVIQEHELLECLLFLPLLEELRLWDPTEGESGGALIDNLLGQLTWRLGQTNLVPHLNILGLTSVIDFRDDSILEFVTSRIERGLPENNPFVVMILYSGCRRELSPEVVAQLTELEDSGDLIFAIGRV